MKKELTLNEAQERLLNELGKTKTDIETQTTQKIETFLDEKIYPLMGGEDETADLAIDLYLKITNVRPTAQFEETDYSFPAGNHTEAETYNLGWTQGMIQKKILFEAELWRQEKKLYASFLLPELELKICTEDGEKFEETILRENDEYVDYAALPRDMKMEGFVYENERIQAYVYFLEEAGLLRFKDDHRNGSVMKFTNANDEKIVCVSVQIKEENDQMVRVPLHFKDFCQKECYVQNNAHGV